MQGHLPRLIGIFIMHVMDDVHGIGIQPRCILQHLFIVGAHPVVLQHLAGERLDTRHDDAALYLVHAAIDGVQKGLCQVAPRAEELHLFAHAHGRDTAGNGIVVAVDRAHDIVVLVLDGICCNGHFCAVSLELVGQVLAPQHGEVRLRRGAQVCQRVQDAERCLRHKRLSVQADAADGFRHPSGVAAEQLVVIRRAQVAHKAQFDDELVYQLLRFGLGDSAVRKVALDINIKKGGGAAQRGGRTVVFLDARKVGHVQKLNRLFCILCGAGNVDAVARGHRLYFSQRAYLLGHLLAQADALFRHGAVQRVQIAALFLCQRVDAVQGHAAVIANDAPTAVGVRQARQQARMARGAHARRVCVEHALVVRFAIFREGMLHLLIQRIAVLLQRCLGAAHAAVGVHNALQRRVRLQAHNHLVVPVDVARLKVVNAGKPLRLHVQHAFLQLLLQKRLAFFPHSLRARRGGRKKPFAALVQRKIFLNKAAHINAALPFAGRKALPLRVLHHPFCPLSCFPAYAGKKTASYCLQRCASMGGVPCKGYSMPSAAYFFTPSV